MKKTFLVALLATTIFACTTPAEKTASTETDATASSCVKEGPEVELMKKAITEKKTGEKYASKSAKMKHEKSESKKEMIKEYGMKAAMKKMKK